MTTTRGQIADPADHTDPTQVSMFELSRSYRSHPGKHVCEISISYRSQPGKHVWKIYIQIPTRQTCVKDLHHTDPISEIWSTLDPADLIDPISQIWSRSRKSCRSHSANMYRSWRSYRSHPRQTRAKDLDHRSYICFPGKHMCKWS